MSIGKGQYAKKQIPLARVAGLLTVKGEEPAGRRGLTEALHPGAGWGGGVPLQASFTPKHFPFEASAGANE